MLMFRPDKDPTIFRNMDPDQTLYNMIYGTKTAGSRRTRIRNPGLYSTVSTHQADSVFSKAFF